MTLCGIRVPGHDIITLGVRGGECCILTWSSYDPVFVSVSKPDMNFKVCPKTPRSQPYSGFSSEMGAGHLILYDIAQKRFLTLSVKKLVLV